MQKNFISLFFALKAKLQVLKFEFCQIKLGYRTTNKLVINRQNFAQVGLELKFAFKIRMLEINHGRHTTHKLFCFEGHTGVFGIAIALLLTSKFKSVCIAFDHKNVSDL